MKRVQAASACSIAISAEVHIVEMHTTVYKGKKTYRIL